MNLAKCIDPSTRLSLLCRSGSLRMTMQKFADASFWRIKTNTGHPAAHALARYRCFLPDLAGLAGLRRAGPGKTNFSTFVSLARENAGCARTDFRENNWVAASDTN